VTLLIITAIAMFGGWYVAHQKKGGKILKTLGWVVLFLGFIRILFFIYGLYQSASAYFIFGACFILLLYSCMIFGAGLLLVFTKFEKETIQCNPLLIDKSTNDVSG